MSLSPEQVTGVAVALLAGSEMLALMPQVRANGWVPLVVAVIRALAQQDRSFKRDGRR